MSDFFRHTTIKITAAAQEVDAHFCLARARAYQEVLLHFPLISELNNFPFN